MENNDLVTILDAKRLGIKVGDPLYEILHAAGKMNLHLTLGQAQKATWESQQGVAIWEAIYNAKEMKVK